MGESVYSTFLLPGNKIQAICLSGILNPVRIISSPDVALNEIKITCDRHPIGVTQENGNLFVEGNLVLGQEEAKLAVSIKVHPTSQIQIENCRSVILEGPVLICNFTMKGKNEITADSIQYLQAVLGDSAKLIVTRVSGTISLEASGKSTAVLDKIDCDATLVEADKKSKVFLCGYSKKFQASVKDSSGGDQQYMIGNIPESISDSIDASNLKFDIFEPNFGLEPSDEDL